MFSRNRSTTCEAASTVEACRNNAVAGEQFKAGGSRVTKETHSIKIKEKMGKFLLLYLISLIIGWPLCQFHNKSLKKDIDRNPHPV